MRAASLSTCVLGSTVAVACSSTLQLSEFRLPTPNFPPYILRGNPPGPLIGPEGLDPPGACAELLFLLVWPMASSSPTFRLPSSIAVKVKSVTPNFTRTGCRVLSGSNFQTMPQSSRWLPPPAPSPPAGAPDGLAGPASTPEPPCPCLRIVPALLAGAFPPAAAAAKRPPAPPRGPSVMLYLANSALRSSSEISGWKRRAPLGTLITLFSQATGMVTQAVMPGNSFFSGLSK